MANTKRASHRRVVLSDAKTIKQTAAYIQALWTAPARVYDGQMGGRIREQHEYPENSPQAWGDLHRVTGQMIDVLTSLRDYAAEQQREVQ